MPAIVPVNVAALRVSSADESNVTGKFVGESVAFDQLQYGPDATQASTGDTIWRPLEYGDTPIEKLRAGVHLHWELPEHFKRGTQNPDTGAIEFPPAPNRWLVVREVSVWDPQHATYGEVRNHAWVVESDFVAPRPQRDDDGIARPTVSVPLTDPASGAPFQYMGRVVDAARWDPSSEPPTDYLPSYTGSDQKALALTSIGFVGAAFSSYYPDCRSVFGFWDTFADDDDLRSAITGAEPIRFRASYRVVGWLHGTADPLASIAADVTTEWEAYAAHCAKEKIPVLETPRDVFLRLASQRFGWDFQDDAVSFETDGGKVTALTVPSTTLCAGTVQEVVWDQTHPSEQTPFLTTPQGGATWEDTVDAAIGNTTVEAISALIKHHLGVPEGGGTGVLSDYEALLDALQLGLLHDLESDGNALATLQEALHARSFTQVDGGHTWTIQAEATDGAQTASAELTLPLALAEQLAALNVAQREYDRARQALVAQRQQLFMDWIIYVKQAVAGGGPPIDPSAFQAFLATSSGGELNAVIAAGDDAGLVHFELDHDHVVTGISTLSGASSKAAKVVDLHGVVARALEATQAHWVLDAAPAKPFAVPTDPVLVMEGDALEPVRRNGPTLSIPVRTDAELIGALELKSGTGTWTVAASALAGLPTAPSAVPEATAATAFLAEAALLDPLHASAIAAATGTADAGQLTAAIAATQGGQSPLDSAALGGLFDAIRGEAWEPTENPAVTVQAPTALTTTFTNAAGTAWSPDAVGWSAQRRVSLSKERVDPFLPVWLTWNVQLDPLAYSGGTIDPATIETEFDPTTLAYPLPASFTTGELVGYHGSVALSKKPMVSLTQQIDRYIADFPHDDQADQELRAARDDFAGRRVLSQALGGFGQTQTLRLAIPQLPVENLTPGGDDYTTAIADAAGATTGDNWYDTGFNALAPLSVGLQSDYNFGPLRAGFLEVRTLGVVDAFGQQMALTTANRTATGALEVVPTVT